MKQRLLLFVGLALLCAVPAQAHIGSPDIFFDGMVGPWAAHITIRVPGVVPGLAKILVQVQTKEPVEVSIVPLASGIAVSNAPPPEPAQLVTGETNIYSGDLWLMTIGAYSIDVRIHGKGGEGAVQIPVDSIARAQLPLPPILGQILLVLGVVLFCGAMAIVAAAAGESTVAPGALAGKRERRKYWIAATVTGLVLGLGLVGGHKWWNAEESNFRTRLLEGGWPDLSAEVRIEDSQRILHLTLGEEDLGAKGRLDLEPDHGKLLHLFLIGQSNHQAFAHIHPVREGNLRFKVALPPLPEGNYEMFCDLTLVDGFSSTATNMVHLPPLPASVATGGTNSLEPDPDDSWAVNSAVTVSEKSGGDTFDHLPGGAQVIWKAHPALHAKQDAGLQFLALDSAGKPAHLEPYMGMMSHAAVMRSDGKVFVHLHPWGNYSMAAQVFFEGKIAKETGAAGGQGDLARAKANHAKLEEWCGPPPPGGTDSSVSLPYEFPTPGDYLVWVQIKTDGQIRTASFETTVN